MYQTFYKTHITRFQKIRPQIVCSVADGVLHIQNFKITQNRTKIKCLDSSLFLMYINIII